jgi:hypothetical protein
MVVAETVHVGAVAEAETELDLGQSELLIRPRQISPDQLVSASLSRAAEGDAFSAGEDDQTGTDPSFFGTKFMPYYRYTDLRNGLEQQEVTAFGFVAVLGFDPSSICRISVLEDENHKNYYVLRVLPCSVINSMHSLHPKTHPPWLEIKQHAYIRAGFKRMHSRVNPRQPR